MYAKDVLFGLCQLFLLQAGVDVLGAKKRKDSQGNSFY